MTRASRLIYDTVRSPALEGNLFGDSSDRSAIVYLPPSYATASEARYPVVYLLHGYTSHNTAWIDGTYRGLNVQSAMDSLLAVGTIREMIIVMPDAYNRYRGNAYANSPVIGNWEDFFARDLPSYIDSTYRTIPQATSRAIAGHSSGGSQAVKWAMKHPDVYSAVYAMSPANISLVEVLESRRGLIGRILEFTDIGQFDTAAFAVQSTIATAAGLSPNRENPPFFADFPFVEVGGTLRRVDSVWKQWMRHDLPTMLETYRDNVTQLEIHVDIGTRDPLLPQNRVFAQALLDARIPHEFALYEGKHKDRICERLTTRVLPFFSKAMAVED